MILEFILEEEQEIGVIVGKTVLVVSEILFNFYRGPHCPKMEMNKEKPSKFQIHFPVVLVPCTMKKKNLEKSFVFGLPR